MEGHEMKRHVLVGLLAAAFAMGASAADPAKPAAKGTEPAKPAAAPKGKPVPPALTALKNAKGGFLAAVGACARPETCDPKSTSSNPDLVQAVQGKEQAFMVACQACASEAACEEERVKIRDGRGRLGFAPCVPPDGSTPAASTAKDAKADPAKAPKKPPAAKDAPK
jgi:hypothetical protein